jgi:hypothetical protein
MHRPVTSSIQRALPQASSARRRSLSGSSNLSLWGGTTHPYENLKPPLAPAAGTGISIPTPPSRAERIERLHRKHVENLFQKTAASHSNLSTSTDTRLKTAVPLLERHSLSEPPLFRTDGPLTPYPIELDSGEVLEPVHATLVRVLDRTGEERTIVVAEVDGEGGKRKRILLSVDLEGWQREGDNRPVAARQVSAEEVYATVDLDPPKAGP